MPVAVAQHFGTGFLAAAATGLFLPRRKRKKITKSLISNQNGQILDKNKN